jgi:hypothetical protein
MINQIIVGSKKNGALFFNIVQHLTHQEKYKSHKKITASSFHGLLKTILNAQDTIKDLGVNTQTVWHNGFVRGQSTKKLRRCTPLTKVELDELKSIILLITSNKKITEEIFKLKELVA